MGNFSFSQLIILFLFVLLVFGDFSKILTNVKTILKKRNLQLTKKKHRKKGS
jgi:Sec-independent protein translocase protein TatA